MDVVMSASISVRINSKLKRKFKLDLIGICVNLFITFLQYLISSVVVLQKHIEKSHWTYFFILE